MTAFEKLFLNDALPVLNDMHGASVCLVRGSYTSDEFIARRKAIRTETFGNLTDSTVTVREYFLPRASIVLGGNETVPQPGDVIYEGDEQWELFVPEGTTKAAELVREQEWHCHTRKL